MARKKKLLPKDFDDLLKQGDLATLTAVFDTCEIDARGGFGKKTALAFDLCPDDLSRWLVAHGADLAAVDTYGDTPLHERARSRRGRIDVLLELGADPHAVSKRGETPLHVTAHSCNVRNAQALIAAGAQVDAPGPQGRTPLELALQRCTNITIEHAVPFAEALLAAGAARTPRMPGFVEEIGKRFEFSRAAFNPDSVDAVSAALDRLYVLFGVTPVARRAMHDGRAPIRAKAATWQERHQELWELLVPPNGAAATAQGEAIRIAGRIAREIDHNGGTNWDADFNRMADAFLVLVAQGQALPETQLAEARTLVTEIKRQRGDTLRLAELAGEWVALNPTPIAFGAPGYRR